MLLYGILGGKVRSAVDGLSAEIISNVDGDKVCPVFVGSLVSLFGKIDGIDDEVAVGSNVGISDEILDGNADIIDDGNVENGDDSGMIEGSKDGFGRVSRNCTTGSEDGFVDDFTDGFVDTCTDGPKIGRAHV